MIDSSRATIDPQQSAWRAADPKAAVGTGGDRAHQVTSQSGVLDPGPGIWFQGIQSAIGTCPRDAGRILKYRSDIIVAESFKACPALPLVVADHPGQPRAAKAGPH